LQQITRLLDNSAHAPKADPRERLRGFIIATEGYPTHIMRRAVNNFISGTTDPRHNPDWPVQPAHLANECRRIHAQHVDNQNRNKLAIAQIREREEKFHQQPAEIRKAAVADGLARLDVLRDPLEGFGGFRAPEPVEDRIARHDAFFVDPTDDAKKARLLKPRI
jgi:hypothetical protein